MYMWPYLFDIISFTRNLFKYLELEHLILFHFPKCMRSFKNAMANGDFKGSVILPRKQTWTHVNILI